MRKPVIALLVILFLSTTAHAQYFGRNKVQWEHFDFKIMKTEHFDIYYYDREADVVNDIGRMAERWYARYSRLCNHTFTRKPIVLYANTADFPQTTTTPEIIGQGTGGFTDPFMNRVVLPLTGDYAENDHVLGHELVHVFQFDIAASLTNNRRRFNLEALPLWLVEGMAEYFSKGRIDPLTAMWIRDATIHNRMPDLRKLTRDPNYFPYRYGQALLAYIGGRFGDDAVVRLFLASGISGPETAFDRALGIPAKQIFIDWAESARELYNPVVEDRPANLGAPIVAGRRGLRNQLNIGPAYSPDGQQLAFLSTRDIFDVDLFLFDLNSKQVRQLTNDKYADLQPTFSPDGRTIAFVSDRGSEGSLDQLRFTGMSIATIDVETGRIRTLPLFAHSKSFDPHFAPDGESLYFISNPEGVPDVYRYYFGDGHVARVTHVQTGVSGITEMSPALTVAQKSVDVA